MNIPSFRLHASSCRFVHNLGKLMRLNKSKSRFIKGAKYKKFERAHPGYYILKIESCDGDGMRPKFLCLIIIFARIPTHTKIHHHFWQTA